MKFRRLGSNLYIIIFFFKQLACFQSYGENCKYPCSLQCYNNICDTFNGQCLLDCKDGFYGKLCPAGDTFLILHILVNYRALILFVNILKFH